MHIRRLLLIATLVAPTLPVTATVLADETHEKAEKDEKVVKLSDIPAPARQTILKEAKGAPIVRVEQEKENGRTTYEGVVKQGKEEIGIVVDAKGTLLGKHSETSEKGGK